MRRLMICLAILSLASPAVLADYVLTSNDGWVRRFTDDFTTQLWSTSAANAPSAVLFGPDGNIYVSRLTAGVVEHYNYETGDLIGAVVPDVGSTVNAVAGGTVTLQSGGSHNVEAMTFGDIGGPAGFGLAHSEGGLRTILMLGGEARAVAEWKARTAGRENLRWLGHVPNADVPLYQAACDALLMPYQQRVAASSGGDIARYLSPMKLFEYLACGRAILTGDLPVLREVLNERNAVILPSEGPDAWAAAIKGLRLDVQRCAALGRQARQDAKRYTWEGRARLILDGLGPEA